MSKDISKKYLIVVGGPTASGKTTLAIEIAQYYHTEIISADSRQFYREMNIGTAKPTPGELAKVPHHFINSLSIYEPYSVGAYENEALQLLTSLFQTKDVVVMVGGSGFYIQAVCEGLDEFPNVAEEVVKGLEKELVEKGLKQLQEELKTKDPVYYKQVDLHNPARLIRALSIIRQTGKKFSDFHTQKEMPRYFETVYLLPELSRPELYKKINERVDKMVETGLFEEAKKLYPFKHLKSLQTVGYQEFFDHLEGKISFTEAVEKIKQNTRRYAKRQMTWFRKYGNWNTFSYSDKEAIFKFLNMRIS